MPEKRPTRVAVARNAMATRFEVVVCGENEPSLRAAAEEALSEVERIEAQLSLYRPDSVVARLNATAAHEWVRVDSDLFRLLQQARELSAQTDGAFDITVAPLMRCWGFMRANGRRPLKQEVAAARQCVGMHLVELDPQNFAVHFQRVGVALDFGAIGKGYAIEKAVELLREAGVTSALIHGGTSTAYGLGTQEDGTPWKVAIDANPRTENSPPALLAIAELENAALSVSAVWGKSFEEDGKTYGHIIDARTGYPAHSADLAAVILPSATETDALSTALLTFGVEEHDRIATLRPGIRTLVMKREGSAMRTRENGFRILKS